MNEIWDVRGVGEMKKEEDEYVFYLKSFLNIIRNLIIPIIGPSVLFLYTNV